MMAINDVNKRPTWENDATEIDEGMNLVLAGTGKIIAPANLYFDLKGVPSEEPAVTARKLPGTGEPLTAKEIALASGEPRFLVGEKIPAGMMPAIRRNLGLDKVTR
jgi:hypothetical protein